MGSIEQFLNKVHCGDSLTLLRKMPSDSVDLVMTSPPYWGLRQYSGEVETMWGGSGDCQHQWVPLNSDLSLKSGGWSVCYKCGATKGQLGLEPTFTLYIDHLLEIFGEVKRVLKPTGSFWLNMGDSSYGSGDLLPKKCLIGLPWRVALRMVDEQGWVLRNDVIWFKPNGMPESTQDNLTAHHEYVFFFAKQTLKPYLWRNVKTKEWVKEKPVQSWFDDQGSYQTYWWRCEGVVDRFGEVVEPCDAKGEGWKTRLQHKKMNEKHTITGPSPLWCGFHYFFDLDAIRVPHTVCGVTDKRPMGIRRQRLYEGSAERYGSSGDSHLTQYFGKFDGIGEEKAEAFGSPRARTQRSNKFNMRVRLATRPKGGLESYPDVKVSESEALTYDSGGRKQDNVPSRNVATYTGFNDRWKQSSGRYTGAEKEGVDPRYTEGSGPMSWKAWKENHASNTHLLGKNPGDIIEVSPEVSSKDSLVNMRPSRWGQDHPIHDPERWFADGGKNPGDFWTLTPEPTKAHHFAAYPLKLCFTPILAACPPDGVVLDPFAGTGTTAEAVEILNITDKKPDWETVKKIRADIKTGHKPLVYAASRKWILLEISNGYCEIAGKRLAPYI